MNNKPIVAIVGRPNVGKSTLFNRFCKKRSAIVDFEEGITRDRKYETAEWNKRTFIFVDTGGIIPDSQLSIDQAVQIQVQIAIEQADAIILLCDVKTGITKYDQQIARKLSAYRKKTLLVVNKVDNEKDELDLYDFLKMGLGDPIGIAASSGRNMGNFLDELVYLLNSLDFQWEIDDQEKELIYDHVRVAIVGKPNVGKSSLINRLVGENSVIVTDVPGTTRDPIDFAVLYPQYLDREKTILPSEESQLTNPIHRSEQIPSYIKIIFTDTAGLRKKSKIKYGVEYFSSMRTIESIDKSDIILLLLDSFEEFSEQDQKIASYAQRKFKNIIIILNKWDLVTDKNNKTFNNYIHKVKDDFNFLDYAPVLTISAKTGQRVQKVPETICQVWKESNRRITTGELNRFFERVIQKTPPTHSSGKHIKIYYVTQNNINPPTFVFFTNEPSFIPVNYKRFLKNKLREEFKFTGATLKLIFRGKENDNFMVEY